MVDTRKTVVLADDHPVVLAGVKALIEGSGEFRVVGEASSSQQALAVAAELKPDLAVVDLSMPGMNGVDLVAQLARLLPATMVVVLTVHEELAYVNQVLRAGGRGYVLKRSAADELVRALRSVMANGLYVDPVVAARMLGKTNRSIVAGAELSEREEAVARAAARGYPNKEVAARMNISVKTVETYKARAMEKLNCSTRADLVRHAAASGWMSEG